MFGLYLMAYTAGRSWIEMLRIDDAHTVLGLRLNVWTSLLVFTLGVLVFVIAGRLGHPTTVVTDDNEAAADTEETGDEVVPDDSDADDIVGAGVTEEESADESTLEAF